MELFLLVFRVYGNFKLNYTSVTCSAMDPLGECELLIDGLTSVIDVEIVPDELLYVVKFDEGSWFASFLPFLVSGGKLSSSDLEGNLVEVVASGLVFPSVLRLTKLAIIG